MKRSTYKVTSKPDSDVLPIEKPDSKPMTTGSGFNSMVSDPISRPNKKKDTIPEPDALKDKLKYFIKFKF